MKDKVSRDRKAGEVEASEPRFVTLETMQREHVRNVLKITDHDLSRAAAMLEIELPELRRLMKRLNIR